MHLRLLKLVQYRFLTVIRIPQQKHIYGLGKSALPILVEEGIAEEGILAHRIRMRELKELFLKHEMLIVDIHVMFTLAAQGRELKPVAWKEGRELHDTVTVDMVDGQRRLPVRPDAFFSLEDSRRSAGANRAHFFLEADRSTETQARFTEKIKAYWHYLQQGLHKEKHKIKSFRVLTITLMRELKTFANLPPQSSQRVLGSFSYLPHSSNSQSRILRLCWILYFAPLEL